MRPPAQSLSTIESEKSETDRMLTHLATVERVLDDHVSVLGLTAMRIGTASTA